MGAQKGKGGVIASFNPNTMKEPTAVRKKNIREAEKSRVDYEVLEGWARGKLQNSSRIF